MTIRRTQVRVKTIDGTYKLVDAVASVKVAGYVFLIHKSASQAGEWSATYAPVGIGVTDYDSIADVIASLDRHADQTDDAVARALRTMAETNTPLLAPETGIESTASWQWREQSRFD